jgi:hypothetical protein
MGGLRTLSAPPLSDTLATTGKVVGMKWFGRKTFLLLFFVATTASGMELPAGRLAELRQLSEKEREFAFQKLDEKTKVDLFFEANRRHPPYTGLDYSIERGGLDLLMTIRRELEGRGGVPEVLSFMGIVYDMKNHGHMSLEDIRRLEIKGLCGRLAEKSEYCPKLEAKILSS